MTLHASPVRIRAITLDLDDTLWPAQPTLMRAEDRAHAWLAMHAPAVAAMWPVEKFREMRMGHYHAHPELHHHLLQIRRIALRDAFSQAGVTPVASLIEEALNVFMAARNEVTLFPDVEGSLARLAQRYALGSLTNGNADITTMRIAPHFSAVVSAHTHGTTKPDPAIFHMACRELGCAPHEVLHVGDDIELDVRGARDAGMHVAWINRGDAVWEGTDAPLVVRDLPELEAWLEANSQ
jgi:putative hydrolase of the HAD superfamily